MFQKIQTSSKLINQTNFSYFSKEIFILFSKLHVQNSYQVLNNLINIINTPSYNSQVNKRKKNKLQISAEEK